MAGKYKILTSVYSKYKSLVLRKNNVWAQDNVIKSPFKNVEIPNCTLNEYVWKRIDGWPKKMATVCGHTGRGYSYENFYMLSQTFAANLRIKFKIQNGDTVAIMLPNVPEYPLVALGILEAGGVITSVHPICTAYEVERQLTMAAVKIIVTLPTIVPIVKEALKRAKLNIPIIVLKINGEANPEGTVVFDELTEDVHVDKSCLKKVRRTASDICFLPYSSGTTGLPKGVELSHRNIIANLEQVNEPMIQGHNETTTTHQDVVIGILPFAHIYAASMLMFHKMSIGSKLVTVSKYQPELFLQILEKHKINIVPVVPPLFSLMASHPAATSKTFEHLQVLVNGAAPLSAIDIEQFYNKANKKVDFRQGYGMTETSPTVTLTKKGAVGFMKTGPPIPNTELRIVDQDLKNLGPNEPGEILIRGPQVMLGYRNNPQANNDSFTADGWFRSGDVGVADEDGVLTITNRLKDMIKVKGFQVAPAELESVFRDHPSVNDAAVIGISHKTKGETPKAFVVLKPGQKCSEKELQYFVNQKLAAYKEVDDITFIDAVPKSAAGKILRSVLKEKYCN